MSNYGSTLEIVTGFDKLLQDLDCWLKERYGGDRFHTLMGSTLQDYIGGVNTTAILREIHDEVLRVLLNYQDMQVRILTANPQSLTRAEMLISIESIDVSADYDAVYVKIQIRNGADQSQTIVAGTTA